MGAILGITFMPISVLSKRIATGKFPTLHDLDCIFIGTGMIYGGLALMAHTANGLINHNIGVFAQDLPGLAFGAIAEIYFGLKIAAKGI